MYHSHQEVHELGLLLDRDLKEINNYGNNFALHKYIFLVNHPAKHIFKQFHNFKTKIY